MSDELTQTAAAPCVMTTHWAPRSFSVRIAARRSSSPVQRPAERPGQLLAVGLDDVRLQVQNGKQPVAAEIEHGGAGRPFDQLTIESVRHALRQRADQHDDVGTSGLFAVGLAERVEFVGVRGRPFSTNSVMPPVAGPRSWCRSRVAALVRDPAIGHAQGGEFGFDLRHGRTAHRGQRQARAAQMMRRNARVEAPCRKRTRSPRPPIHLAVAKRIEDEDLLPGRGQSGGQDHAWAPEFWLDACYDAWHGGILFSAGSLSVVSSRSDVNAQRREPDAIPQPRAAGVADDGPRAAIWRSAEACYNERPGVPHVDPQADPLFNGTSRWRGTWYAGDTFTRDRSMPFLNLPLDRCRRRAPCRARYHPRTSFEQVVCRPDSRGFRGS